MALVEVPPRAAAAVQLRHRRDLDEVDLRRELVALSEEGYSQTRIAQWLQISQSAVSQLLKTARGGSVARAGFSGASPRELCQRYAAGLLSREQVVDELTRWEYVPMAQHEAYEDLPVQPEGTIWDVYRAAMDGLIDEGLYGEVAARVAADASA
ncbi:helix-turn-helix domain-containing protein [Litorihabitans aurantiacus]|uniref:Uncharacterized protein n=1 Tax=Litorihabitans aurantiacus TaxID=1930061 RepID=A0AA37XJ16_9MICO|nr:helix-turn-helix domain-containing protein [Litorihabitans aurantiacus]GMA33641.1 hypothetical protein GCM10025875_36330 [Litorihabitans aurantiacus]GMA33708.1 hypothetical protein GCM10025875_37000 [Litorihabitans aurantiacus]GMA33771.1 hypothetical protein GCM10025875_37630 [Litorihabitans aurantiacus]